MTLGPLPPVALAEAEGRLTWLAGRVAVPTMSPVQRGQLLRLLLGSDFLLEAFAADPELLPGVLDADPAHPGQRETVAGALEALLADAIQVEDFDRRLRQFRRRRIARILWRELNRLVELEDICSELSDLAELCVERALQFHEARALERWGVALDSRGERQRLVVIGMGKLGGRELNLSSDIDLVFAYAEGGETQGGERSTDCGEYFTWIARQLIASLSTPAGDGLVFRVDVRLRPYGASGPLVVSFAQLDIYYEEQARDWERYALIKARALAGDLRAGQRLLESLRPFVYRRYLDWGALAALRELKAQINSEATRLGKAEDIKVGRGGIREIEFAAQILQLIYGGRDANLRQRELAVALVELVEAGHLPAAQALSLANCYRFLRHLEHAIQGQRDEQSHRLPTDPARRRRLAWALGLEDLPALEEALARCREQVRACFDGILAQGGAPAPPAADLWRRLWMGEADPGELALRGLDDAEEFADALSKFRDSSLVKLLQRRARNRLDQLMPSLLAITPCAEVLRRLLSLLRSVVRRSSYLALLIENPLALARLVKIVAASRWVAERLVAHPVLLDELLSPPRGDKPGEEVRTELRRRLRSLADDDEALADAFSAFKQGREMEIALADLDGRLPLMKVSDALTGLAEQCLTETLERAWREVEARRGAPWPGAEPGDGFAIIAYGKFGGLELGYGSDLDLVFLFDPSQAGDAERVVDFFSLLARRIIHRLTATTVAGRLYEIDTRLRPSGSSGLLVSDFNAFADYQRRQAWTWEHQALVRARPVAGSAALGEAFVALRREVLMMPRNLDALRSEVWGMRQRMRDEKRADGENFDCRQDPGGIVDIEFVVQYSVLVMACEHAEFTLWTDNFRLLREIDKSRVLPRRVAAFLGTFYLELRTIIHQLALDNRPALISRDELSMEFCNHTARVKKIVSAVFGQSGERTQGGK